jgi:aminobenzoyl-glutamate utilization protein B
MFDRDAMKIEVMAGLALIAILIAVSTPLADDTTRSKDEIARIEKFKAVVADGVETRRKLAQVMNDTVFSFGELAY